MSHGIFFVVATAENVMLSHEKFLLKTFQLTLKCFIHLRIINNHKFIIEFDISHKRLLMLAFVYCNIISINNNE